MREVQHGARRRQDEESRKSGILRPFLLGTMLLSDFAFWTTFFIRVSRMEPGIKAGAAEIVPLVLAILLAVSFTVLWQGVFQQLDDLEDGIRHWETDSPKEREVVFTSLSGPVRPAGDAYYRQRRRLDETLDTIRQETRTETERTVKLQIARDICRSALPGRLPDYPSRENFAVAGTVRDGWGNACVYYDFFFVDPGLLCISVGQVPDGEVPEALFLTVAQTTIRSRLRLGRSLAETMGDVNTQLYDLGGSRFAAVLVGTLDVTNGKFSYVNAGGCPPLLAKNEQNYEWIDASQFTPLGQSQNVTYRTQALRLRQGDRLFLHTVGLGAETDAEGVAFRERELRSALTRTREIAVAEGVERVADWAEQYTLPESRLGYAALMLEFRKGDRDLSHCRVPASPDSAPEVLEFLKGRFGENGIQRRHYAKVAVLAEELFTLCCRRTTPDAILTVECGVAPDGETVNIRITGPFQGRNPLRDTRENTPDGQSAEFIGEHAEYTRFKAGEADGRDTVTVVCFLS